MGFYLIRLQENLMPIFLQGINQGLRSMSQSIFALICINQGEEDSKANTCN